jgi:DNA-binding MarR family transcriptional regulator
MTKKNPVTTQSTDVIPGERYDLRILQSLRRIVRSIDIHSRKLSTQSDITVPQLISLLAIMNNSPLTIASLSKEVHLSPSTLVGVIDRLERKKLVIRERDNIDRRKVLIHITDQGRKFANEAPSPLQETFAKALGKLGDLEQSTIALSLERIVNLMEAEKLDASPILKTGVIVEKD